MLTPMTGLYVAWGIVTALLVSLIAYRSVIGIKEDDQLFFGLPPLYVPKRLRFSNNS